MLNVAGKTFNIASRLTFKAFTGYQSFNAIKFITGFNFSMR